jgi:tetratricopeptide (TPR) repeat protein
MIVLRWPDEIVLPSRRVVVLGALALVAALLVLTGVWYWRSAREQQATAAYATALARLGPARSQDATPEVRAAAARELEAALQAHPSASMAAQAAFELAGLRYADRQYAQARAAYEVALARASAPTLRVLARVGIAYTWEAERDYAKAIETFNATLAEMKPGDFLYAEALIDLGRVQELAGRKDDAIQTYRRLLKDVPAWRGADDLRARLAALGATP